MPNWAWGLLTVTLSTLLGFILPRLQTTAQSKINDQLRELNGRITALEDAKFSTGQRIEMERRLTIIETDIRLVKANDENTRSTHIDLLRLLEKALIPVAHSPHTAELDRLLDKRARGEDLTREELSELLRRLRDQARIEAGPGKQIALLGLRAVLIAQYRYQKRQQAIEASV